MDVTAAEPTCSWCCNEDGALVLLKQYCAGSLSAEETKRVEVDLFWCTECIAVYYERRRHLPELHKSLWELETSRLLRVFSNASEEDEDEDDDLYLVEDDHTVSKVPKISPAQYATIVRFPMLEILQQPRLLAHQELSELCLGALRKMVKADLFDVHQKHPGIYLLLLHPDEMVRRWAIGVARSLGNVNEAAFRCLQEVVHCMFSVVERGFKNMFPPPDPSSTLTIVPAHLFDRGNEKNFWLGICMLLTQLDIQATRTLFLRLGNGPDAQDYIQCILNAMEYSMKDDKTAAFWPAMHCFMLVLDRLGRSIWARNRKPNTIFYMIIDHSCYKGEINRIKDSQEWVKEESVADDNVTCSQMVYGCSKVAPDGQHTQDIDNVVYEEMRSLAKLLQSDLGKAMRVHNSTFLWFIPFAKSVMDLEFIYIHDVVLKLCEYSDYKEGRPTCDRVADFFVRILVEIVELYLRNGCLEKLQHSVARWVGVVVKQATGKHMDSPIYHGSGLVSSTSLPNSSGSPNKIALSQACIALIRSLLRVGLHLPNTDTRVYHNFLNLLNTHKREVPIMPWNLSMKDNRALQGCLTQLLQHVGPSPPSAQPCSSDTFGPSRHIKEEVCTPPFKTEPLSQPRTPPPSAEGSAGFEGLVEENPGGLKPSADFHSTMRASVNDTGVDLQMGGTRRRVLASSDDSDEEEQMDDTSSKALGSSDSGDEQVDGARQKSMDASYDSGEDELSILALKRASGKRDGVETGQKDGTFILDKAAEKELENINCEPPEGEPPEVNNEPPILNDEPLGLDNMNHSSYRDYDEGNSESQLFEHEIEKQIPSVWAKTDWMARDDQPSTSKELSKSNWIERVAKPCSTNKDKRKVQASTSRLAPSSNAPAIVPPKKVRVAPEPASIAEKLGLTKKKRKAFDFSQPSRTAIDELRRYGQGVQVNPNTKAVKKVNKKFLDSQDRQYFRQSKAKQSNTKCAEQNKAGEGPSHIQPQQAENHKSVPRMTAKKKILPRDDEDELLQPQPECPIGHNASLEKFSLSTTASCSPEYRQKNDVVPSSSGLAVGDLEEGGDDWMQDDEFFLTQRDPVDMDMDSEGDEPIEGRSSIPPQDDHSFVRSGMSPMTLKKATPSTTKIFGTSSSRSASLVRDMARAASSAAAGKGHNGRQVTERTPGAPETRPLPQPGIQLMPPPQPLPQPEILVMPPPLHPPPRSLAKTRTDATSHLLPHTVSTIPVQSDSSGMWNPATLLKQILHWRYDMFQKYKNSGLPPDLCPLPLEPVGINFTSFNHYFSTFYPLMIIETFETLVGEWQKHKDVGMRKHDLSVVETHFSNNMLHVEFEVGKFEQVPGKYLQLDDLVILWLPKKFGSGDEQHQESNAPSRRVPKLRPYFGCVHKSSISSRDQSTSPLTIQMMLTDDIEAGMSVCCEIVGSLASAQREFRALVSLARDGNPMTKALLVPHVSHFTPLEDVAPFKLTGCNEDQERAVRYGWSAVKGHTKGLTKICLINGPPGTGKTKVIVDLLRKIFSEDALPSPFVRGRLSRPKVLLCAPSNVAIDYLMKRVIAAFKMDCPSDPRGNCGNVNLVKIGHFSGAECHRGFNLDDQARKLQSPDLYHRLCKVEEQIDEITFQLQRDPSQSHLQKQRDLIALKKRDIDAQINKIPGKAEKRATILKGAQIICCTLSTSGSPTIEQSHIGHLPFSCVIVDEAGQATETQTLIPVLYRCRSLILVGDAGPLVPTVVSQKAKDLNYDQSLLARLCKCVQDLRGEESQAVVLRKQYRMHPEICSFPASYFYVDELETHSDAAERRKDVNWLFKPYCLFDVRDGREVKERDSYYNKEEVALVVMLVQLIFERQQMKLGVITYYNAQKERILRELAKLEDMDRHIHKGLVKVDTMDGFHGREMDCIIVSCVRANHEGEFGLLANLMNLTITRAKYHLFILGHLHTIRTIKGWGDLIKDAQSRCAIIPTQEKTFKVDRTRVFKETPPSLGRTPASAGSKPASITHRHTTYPGAAAQAICPSPHQRPLSSSEPPPLTRDSSPHQLVRSISTPHAANPMPPNPMPRSRMPVDPRRAARTSHPPHHTPRVSRNPRSGAPSYPVAGQPPSYPGAGQPHLYPGADQPHLYPGADQPHLYPGADQPHLHSGDPRQEGRGPQMEVSLQYNRVSRYGVVPPRRQSLLPPPATTRPNHRKCWSPPRPPRRGR